MRNLMFPRRNSP